MLTLALATAGACTRTSPPAPGVPATVPLADGGVATNEALVDLGPRAGRDVFALSDVHGGYDRMVALLVAAHLVSSIPRVPTAIAWSGGKNVLVVVGDLIDKGPQPIEVLEALSSLEARAAEAGGRVVVLLGNHEAELFANPTNTKATSSDGIVPALEALGIAPSDFAAGNDPRGAWLRLRPFGARIGDAFFAHAGDTHGATFEALSAQLATARARDFTDAAIVGDASILESRDWYGDDAVVEAATRAMGVARIVFGHDPNALGPRGSIATAKGYALVRIDCGMSPDVNDSTGCVLRIGDDGGFEVGQELRADGSVRDLWRIAR